MTKHDKQMLLLVGLAGTAIAFYMLAAKRQTALPASSNYNPLVGYSALALGVGSSLTTLGEVII